MLTKTYYGVVRAADRDDPNVVGKMTVYADVAHAHAIASANTFEYPSLGEWIVVPMRVVLQAIATPIIVDEQGAQTC